MRIMHQCALCNPKYGNFRDDQIYKALGNILFSHFNKSLFEDRSKNGIVYSYTFQSDKVVLHLHSTTNTFHMQGKGAISLFQETFKTFAKQLHDECKICVFSNQESSKTYNSVNTNISGDQKSNPYVIF